MTFSINLSTIRHSVTGYGWTRTSWEMKSTASSRERIPECRKGAEKDVQREEVGWQEADAHQIIKSENRCTDARVWWERLRRVHVHGLRRRWRMRRMQEAWLQGVQREEDHARRQCTANSPELPLLDGTPHWRVEVLRLPWLLRSALDEIQWMGRMSVFT